MGSSRGNGDFLFHSGRVSPLSQCGRNALVFTATSEEVSTRCEEVLTRC